VGFFWDGEVQALEAVGMVAAYVAYVFTCAYWETIEAALCSAKTPPAVLPGEKDAWLHATTNTAFTDSISLHDPLLPPGSSAGALTRPSPPSLDGNLREGIHGAHAAAERDARKVAAALQVRRGGVPCFYLLYMSAVHGSKHARVP